VADSGLKRDGGALASGAQIVLGGYAARAAWPSGFSLYESGSRADGVFLVLAGCVVLRTRIKAGRGFVPVIATEGETFGGEGLMPRARYATDARAEGETATAHFSTDSFKAYLREQPNHAFALIAQMMTERTVLIQKMHELSTLGVEQRVLLSLRRLAAGAVYAGEGDELVLHPAQYRLLCELVGATRESVSLVLNRLGREGLVRRDGPTFLVGPLTTLFERSGIVLSEGAPAADRATAIPSQREEARP
jgi:CRP/FNR family transcriptional regulator, cyclic AMP receptor protein